LLVFPGERVGVAGALAHEVADMALHLPVLVSGGSFVFGIGVVVVERLGVAVLLGLEQGGHADVAAIGALAVALGLPQGMVAVVAGLVAGAAVRVARVAIGMVLGNAVRLASIGEGVHRFIFIEVGRVPFMFRMVVL